MQQLIDDFIKYVQENVLGDAALQNRFIYQNPLLETIFNQLYKSKEEITDPIIELYNISCEEDIRAVQATLFKNKGKNPFAIQVKIWYIDNEEKRPKLLPKKADWHGFAELIPRENLDAFFEKSLKRLDEPELKIIKKQLDELAGSCNHVGCLKFQGMGVGTKYYSYHFVGVHIEKEATPVIKHMMLISPNFDMILTKFVTTMANLSPLENTGKAETLCQTRISFGDESLNIKWATDIYMPQQNNSDEVNNDAEY